MIIKRLKIAIRENEEKTVPIVWITNENNQEDTLEIEAILDAPGSRLTLLGVFFGNHHAKITCNIKIIHKAKNTFSRVNLRGVMYDHAEISNDGLIRIDNGAKNSDAFYTSKILLFDDAKGRSVPSLEIDENELKAGHASSVGRPSDLELFYLRSRGLSKKEAERLLVSGFFAPVLEMLSNKEKSMIQKDLRLMI